MKEYKALVEKVTKEIRLVDVAADNEREAIEVILENFDGYFERGQEIEVAELSIHVSAIKEDD